MWGDSLTASVAPYVDALTVWPIYNGGSGGETSTQIKTRLLAAPAHLLAARTLIWAGRNNAGDPTTVKADIAAMVAALTNTNYMVLSILNGDYPLEYQGQSGYATITQLNADLAATYGAKYFDMRAYLVSMYDPGNAQDVLDHSRDVPPSSLRSDVLHLNAAGNALAAQKIKEILGIETNA